MDARWPKEIESLHQWGDMWMLRMWQKRIMHKKEASHEGVMWYQWDGTKCTVCESHHRIGAENLHSLPR
eukprot:2303959-Amphidinium_carterae.2